MTIARTDLAELSRISDERGKRFDASKHDAWCSECGAELGAFGIMHWPDCAGYDDAIRFKEKEATTWTSV